MNALEAVDALYNEGTALSACLASMSELSFQIYHDNQFRKALLLAAASRFETEVKAAVLTFVAERANHDAQIVALTTTKAIERQFHTYFDWERTNANQFFGLFGADFKDYAKGVVAADDSLALGIKSFLELGHLRNQLVHVDFVTFPLEKTPGEIYALYKLAAQFVTRIPSLLRQQL